VATIYIGVKEGNGSAVEVYYQTTLVLGQGLSSVVVTHGLTDANAKLSSAYGVHPSGWYVKASVLAKTLQTMTLGFDVPVPPGGASLDLRIQDST
jgi:hypothetical protein